MIEMEATTLFTRTEVFWQLTRYDKRLVNYLWNFPDLRMLTALTFPLRMIVVPLQLNMLTD